MSVCLRTRTFFILTGLICVLNCVCAQSGSDSLSGYDPDELFAKGRDAAFAGDRERGRIYLRKALEKAPEYADVVVFLARTYLWDEMKEKAEEVLKPLLQKDPDNAEAVKVMFDAAFWSHNNHEALQWAEKGLRKNGTDKELLIKRAQALGALERFDDAVNVLDGLLQRFPGDEEVLQIWNDFKASLNRNTLTAMATYDFYTSEQFGNASLYSLQYGRRTSLGSVFLRGNQSNRFDITGWQAEIDLYPTLGKKMYGYLNYGYSPSPLFPKHRAGAELYRNLPSAFEASAGFRYLYFSPESNVMMYTATLGKYIKSYWLSARAYITPDGTGTSISALFQARRYFSNASHFLGISGGFGFSPEFRNLQSNEGLSTREIYRLKSNRVALMYQHPLNSSWQLTGTFDYARQEFIFDTGNYVGIWSAGVWVRYSF